MTKDAKWRLILVALAGVILLIAFIGVLPQKKVRLAGGNEIPAKQELAALSPGAQACQEDIVVPGGARNLTLGATTRGAPGSRLDATVKVGGRAIAHGTLAGGYVDKGVVGIPITPIDKTYRHPVTCVRNRGPSIVHLFGSPTQSGTPLTAGKKIQGALTIIWYGGSKSWWSLVPAIERHVETASTGFGGSRTLWVVLVLVLAAGALGLRTVLRETST